MRLPERAPGFVEAILQAADCKLPYRVDANRFLGTDAYELAGGAKTIHLLNYCNETPFEKIRITLGDAFADMKSCKLITPDADPNEAPLADVSPSQNEIVVPQIETYCVLVFGK
jgi:hypothetical protein